MVNTSVGSFIILIVYLRVDFFILGGDTMYINGQYRNLMNCSVEQLLHQLDLSANQVVVEVNHKIVQRTDYADFELDEDDKIEIVSFVGGG